MSEPNAIANEVVEVVPGIHHWHVHDDRIDFISAAHAWTSPQGTVLIDPLPLVAGALADLGPVVAIVLTSGGHQRSAWRYRRELGVAVWAPALAREIDEEPDERYGHGDALPAELRAVFTPGAGTTQHALLLGEPAVAFVSDLLVRPPGAPLALVPESHAHDIEEARRSLERLFDEEFDLLCLGHGEPVADDPKGEIRAALAR